MNVYLNEITGIADAIVSLHMSTRSWTKDKEVQIREACKHYLTDTGAFKEGLDSDSLTLWIDTLVKWGWKHITLLKFIDLSFTVEGLHRAGQDDWDAHAKRFDNRIVRSSTRLATFGYEMSEWYQDKILPTDVALTMLGIETPNTVSLAGEKYVKTINGYIRSDLQDDKDVKRGLYMLSIPSNFIFKVNLAEFAHVYKERNIDGTANPEVKIACESMADQIESFHRQFNRDLLMKIKN